MMIHLLISNSPPDRAKDLAHALVKRRLAACVNIIPHVQSVYEWDGELCEELESTLLIKVSSEQREMCRNVLTELHPYDVPEVICIAVDDKGSLPAYLNWVAQQCTPAQLTDS